MSQRTAEIINEYGLTRQKISDPRGYLPKGYLSSSHGSRLLDVEIDIAKWTTVVSISLPDKLIFEWPSIASESAEERFRRLASQWKEESVFMSSIADKVKLPSYQKIIGMGWAAVPLILEDLKKQPQHWFPALRAITDINPVPPEDAGNVKKMAAAWVNWGRQNAIID